MGLNQDKRCSFICSITRVQSICEEILSELLNTHYDKLYSGNKDEGGYYCFWQVNEHMNNKSKTIAILIESMNRTIEDNIKLEYTINVSKNEER